MNWGNVLDGFCRPFVAVDAWAQKQHQTAADWAFTYWDKSPWWLAAQLFPVGIVLRFLEISLEKDSLSGLAIFQAVLFIGLLTFWWFTAVNHHKTWVRTKLTPPVYHPWVWLKTIYLFLGIFITVVTILGLAVLPPEKLANTPVLIASIFNVATVTCGCYFGCCVAPTLKKRKEVHTPLLIEA